MFPSLVPVPWVRNKKPAMRQAHRRVREATFGPFVFLPLERCQTHTFTIAVADDFRFRFSRFRPIVRATRTITDCRSYTAGSATVKQGSRGTGVAAYSPRRQRQRVFENGRGYPNGREDHDEQARRGPGHHSLRRRATP